MNEIIWLAVVFLVLALISYVLGVREIAGFSMEIAKWLVIIFTILAILVILFGGRVGGPGPVQVTPTPTIAPAATLIVDNFTIHENGGCCNITVTVIIKSLNITTGG